MAITSMNRLNIKSIPILVAFLLLPAFPCLAGEYNLAEIKQACDTYGRNEYSKAWKMIDELFKQGLNDYWKIRLNDLRGLIREWAGDKKGAVGWYQEMERIADNSEELAGTAEGYAFSAMARLRQMAIRNKFYALANIPKVTELCNQALAIDPDNKIALMVRATELIRVPKLFGGNPKEAMPLLDRIAVGDLDNNELFTLYYSYATGWLALEDIENAVLYLEKAYSVYPGNSRAAELEAEIRQKTK